MKAINRFRDYVENTDWDDRLLRADERRLKPICWAVLIVCVLYFGAVSIGTLIQ
jgi:hypothetical protein